jgi:MtN3 and saliva related transmembrane protein
MLTELIGYAAASCTTLSFLPQVTKALRERDTKSLSSGMYVIFTIGACLWSVYGYSRRDMAIIAANSVTAMLCLVILVAKLRDDRLGARNGTSAPER